MKEIYYEYSIKTDKFKDEIENFLMERFFNGIEEKDNTLILRSEEPLDEIMEQLREYVKALEEIFSTRINFEINVEKKSNKDWVKLYQESIKPVEIDEFYIHPSWYPPKEGKINIIIDPALAFGSGHHETTRSCVKALKKYVKKDDTLFDVGCGSGILGIVANKLGAVVDACDTDPLAVESAKENFELNNAKYRKIFQGSAADSNETYDVVVANIIADVLVFIANDLKQRVNNILILSGIIDKYKDKVLDKYKDFELLEEIRENEWVTLILRKEVNG
ncbi:50S ribosomal protein L11 methyltransferase [Caminibacter pacificus]|uniref:Ribosomal protein L11 methyltransferase n=1 Tax=Caminibacter pacificus TaxID=1424653 RepID=A0AAJ4RBI4_9BACT|nr:50S ribosomal protein L11 methyltransferase [Caminibacter pacificus]QCI27518.1 50S ribosomal protein L11 methyltransferase [Caminibacter pacificus]ROR38957.1 ribosomal protein L11 methyltransferase [Caminibacter pacificus]